MRLSLHHVAWSALLAVALLGCSSSNSPIAQDGTGATGADTQAGLTGTWKGTLKDVSKNAPADTTPSVVYSTFKTDDTAQSGTFNFTLASDTTAQTNGNFSVFKGQTLLLDVSGSSLSLLGAAGDANNLDYVLTGKMLQLSNDRVLMYLTRQDGSAPTGGTTGGGDTGGGTTANGPLVGKLICTGQHNLEWHLNITDASSFTGNVVPTTAGSRDVWIDGGIAADPAGVYTGILTVNDAADAAFSGVRLGATVNSDKTVAIKLLPAEGDPQPMSCQPAK